MSDFFDRNEERNEMTTEITRDGKMQLRQEELDVIKDRDRAGEVILSKEIIEEKKTMDVPVMHEEVVIERRTLHEPSDAPISAEESIHIPVSEEHVEVGKHTIVTEEVSAYKREVAQTQHIEETIKREEPYIETEGNVHVVRSDASIHDEDSIR